MINDGIFYKNSDFGVNRYTQCHVTQQNINFTKIVFSLSPKNQQNSSGYFGSNFSENDALQSRDVIKRGFY